MTKSNKNLTVIKQNTAGIDIGSKKIFIGIANMPVTSFDTFTSSYKKTKHFSSWTGLAPNLHDSGNRKKNKKVKNKSSAGQIFRVAAHSLTNSKHNAFGAFYKRIRAKKGKLFAMKATARKLAVTYYNIMTKGVDYVEDGIAQYQQKVKEQRVKYLQKQARYFGYSLNQIETS